MSYWYLTETKTTQVAGISDIILGYPSVVRFKQEGLLALAEIHLYNGDIIDNLEIYENRDGSCCAVRYKVSACRWLTQEQLAYLLAYVESHLN